eukprot:TRINITY_DN36265_c0_g1_i2.p2 TRINITY_DN36265_c0_g1~~TRINITY_DN36265_c0_g1_i2.p2  ORF type:complete len:423 (+),score=106.55 TRINITY_DN36265_c0_g1_i2:89-1357(+)
MPGRRPHHTPAPDPVELPAGYTVEVLRSPVAPAAAEELAGFLGHKGELWVSDARLRLSDPRGGALWVLSRQGGAPVAHCCVFWCPQQPRGDRVGQLAHVFTHPDHRRRGLARAVLEQAARSFPGALVLGTGSPGAAALYYLLGWVPIRGSLGERCAPGSSPGGDEMIMFRDPRGRMPAAWCRRLVQEAQSSGEVACRPLRRSDCAQFALLVAAAPGSGKLPLCGIDSGVEGEECLLKALEAQEGGELVAACAVDRRTQRVLAVGVSRGAELQVYSPAPAGHAAAALREYLTACAPHGAAPGRVELAREWRLGLAAEAAGAGERVLGELGAELGALRRELQRVPKAVLQRCIAEREVRVVAHIPPGYFGAWESTAFRPEDDFLAAARAVDGVCSVAAATCCVSTQEVLLGPRPKSGLREGAAV